MPAIITLNKVSKSFTEKPGKTLSVLQDINLNVNAGEFLILLGPSGCGKSTILRIMSGLEKKYDGQMVLSKGTSHNDVSFVFQQFALLPWLTVEENVGLGLVANKIKKDLLDKQVAKELKLFGLEKFAKSRPRELSGGMRQRVGLARALVTNPKIIFLDEPCSELDSFTAEELRTELLQIWSERKVTFVMVSHNIEEALELADRVAILTPRPGSIKEIIKNTLLRPRNKRSPEFFNLYDRIYTTLKP